MFARFFTVKEFTGRHMLIVMLLFFGVIVSVNMTLAWFAAGTWSGLVAKNGYVESINYEKTQAAFERQNRLGWKSRIKLQSGYVVFLVKDAQGKGISDLAIVAKIGRPTTEKLDRAMSFRSVNPGEYLARAPQKSGQWIVEINATGTGGQLYRKKYRILVGANK